MIVSIPSLKNWCQFHLQFSGSSLPNDFFNQPNKPKEVKSILKNSQPPTSQPKSILKNAIPTPIPKQEEVTKLQPQTAKPVKIEQTVTDVPAGLPSG